MSLQVSTWSAWGGGILESDRALDAVAGHLSKELGINIHFIGDPEHYAPDDPDCTDPKCAHEPKARSVERTREYLDRGNFQRVFNKYKNNARIDVGCVGLTGFETCCILAVKAMEVGAKISQAQRNSLQTIYKKAGLYQEGMWQMGMALEEYNNGTPYELKEPDRTDHNIYLAFEAARSNAYNLPAVLTYPADRYFQEGVPTPDPLHASKLLQRRQKGEPTWFPGAPVLRECGACLKKMHLVSGGLQSCAVCQKIMYCNKQCQKSHWKTHKMHCKSFAAAPGPPAIETLEKSPLLVKGFDPLSGRNPSDEVKTTALLCSLM